MKISELKKVYLIGIKGAGMTAIAEILKSKGVDVSGSDTSEVFYTDEFKKWSNNNVVLVELDYPKRKVLDDKLKQQNDYLQRIFGVQGFPTVWFVKPTLTGDKLDLKQLGSTGYIAGGPTTWLGEANKQMAGKK
jgi:protein disulfide-isomerase